MSLKEEWTKKELSETENTNFHSPLNEEYTFYKAVKNGDMDFVRNNLENGDFMNQKGKGILSKNSLTNYRYHFVITVSMITRQCVEGGMELEQAYRLSDFYILKMDSCKSLKEIDSLHADMVLDFTGKMLLLKKQNIISKPIIQCTEYIYNHINERLTIQQLADNCNLSTSYLSRLFKKEIGVSVSDYVRDKKLEKAENLLKYSDLSLIEISNFLSFASESHFIQTFEKRVGLTPKKYRNKYYQSL